MIGSQEHMLHSSTEKWSTLPLKVPIKIEVEASAQQVHASCHDWRKAAKDNISTLRGRNKMQEDVTQYFQVFLLFADDWYVKWSFEKNAWSPKSSSLKCLVILQQCIDLIHIRSRFFKSRWVFTYLDCWLPSDWMPNSVHAVAVHKRGQLAVKKHLLFSSRIL